MNKIVEVDACDRSFNVELYEVPPKAKANWQPAQSQRPVERLGWHDHKIDAEVLVHRYNSEKANDKRPLRAFVVVDDEMQKAQRLRAAVDQLLEDISLGGDYQTPYVRVEQRDQNDRGLGMEFKIENYAYVNLYDTRNVVVETLLDGLLAELIHNAEMYRKRLAEHIAEEQSE